MLSTPFHCIIIGAGASGLLAGWLLARKGLRVALLDHAQKPGRKLALAGGGMGNMTNLRMEERYFVGEERAFCRDGLKKFTPQDVIRLMQSFGMPWEERDDGQIFGIRPAREFADKMANAFTECGGSLFLGQNVSPQRCERGFRVSCGQEMLEAPHLVIATGSPAWPQCGAGDQGTQWARKWGHDIIPFRPALVPLLFGPDEKALGELAGISHMVGLDVGGVKEERSLLFSHQGLSGPAALIASCFWQPGETVTFDFLPGREMKDVLHAPENGKLLIKNLLARHMPERLALALCPADLARKKAAESGKKDRERLEQALCRFTFTPSGSAGFKKAEAARGGVATRQVHPRTLESRLVPGLHFLGEVLDITGLLGGYNLHWAFASASLFAENFPVADKV